MPRNETEADRKAEREIIDILCRQVNLIAGKLSEVHYQVDFALRNRHNTIRYYAEVKARRLRWQQYDEGVYLSAAKVEKGQSLAISGGCSFIFVIGLLDGSIAVAKDLQLGGLPPAVWAGRTDRDQEADMEPMIVIPWDRFKLLIANPQNAPERIT